MVNKKGISLLELVMVTAVAALLAAALGTLLWRQMKGFSLAKTQFLDKASLLPFLGGVQKDMASGDNRIFGFVGKGASDRMLARALVPQPGYCSNLSSTSGCASSTAFFYVKDAKTPRALTAVCMRTSNRLVVDLNNTVYGTASAIPSGFEFNLGGGNKEVLTILPDAPLLLTDLPNSTLWIALTAPYPLNASVDSGGNMISPMPFPQECINNLKNLNNGKPTAASLPGLYEIRIRPFILTRFTGGTTVTNAEIATALPNFPQRLVRPQLNSIGFRPAGGGLPAGLAIHDCGVSVSAINCSSTPIRFVPDLHDFKVRLSFKVALGNQTQTLSYEIVGANGTTSNAASVSCVSPSCRALPVMNPQVIPGRMGSESFEAMNSSAFSLFKMEAISRITFAVTHDMKETFFDVKFP